MVVIDGAFCVEKLKLRATSWVYIAFECNVSSGNNYFIPYIVIIS